MASLLELHQQAGPPTLWVGAITPPDHVTKRGRPPPGRKAPTAA
jgi:hypothetical protein